jgi:hypothetical protein
MEILSGQPLTLEYLLAILVKESMSCTKVSCFAHFLTSSGS